MKIMPEGSIILNLVSVDTHRTHIEITLFIIPMTFCIENGTSDLLYFHEDCNLALGMRCFQDFP